MIRSPGSFNNILNSITDLDTKIETLSKQGYKFEKVLINQKTDVSNFNKFKWDLSSYRFIRITHDYLGVTPSTPSAASEARTGTKDFIVAPNSVLYHGPHAESVATHWTNLYRTVFEIDSNYFLTIRSMTGGNGDDNIWVWGFVEKKLQLINRINNEVYKYAS